MATPRAAQHRDMEQRLRDLERQVRELTAAALSRGPFTVTEGDLVVNGGRIRATRPDGSDGLYFGPLYVNDEKVTEAGLRVLGPPDANGRQESVAWMGARDDPRGQFELFDRLGSLVVSEDGGTGYGLARPYLDVPLYMAGLPNTYTNSTTSWQTAFSGYFNAQGPYLLVSAECWAGASDAGRVRVLIDGEDRGEQDIPNGGAFRNIVVSLHDRYPHMSRHLVELQIRKLSGSASVSVRPVQCRYAETV